jgi:hypothetical protein
MWHFVAASLSINAVSLKRSDAADFSHGSYFQSFQEVTQDLIVAELSGFFAS